jgi:hypothetical protein
MREVRAILGDILKCYSRVNLREVRIEEGWECEGEGLEESITINTTIYEEDGVRRDLITEVIDNKHVWRSVDLYIV